jgi:hypothetical protein
MIEEFAEGCHPNRQISSGKAESGTVKEGTFAGTQEKSARENTGMQGGSQD